MRTRILIVTAVAAAMAHAQVTGSISGVVRDRGTSQPLPEVSVSVDVGVTYTSNSVIQGPNTRMVTAVTDAHGAYKLSNLPAGKYHVMQRSQTRSAQLGHKWVTLADGQDVTGVDFSVAAGGAISGTIYDDNREPIPNVSVSLLTKEYYTGQTGFYPKEIARTNDRGQYTLSRVEAGRAYYVMAVRREGTPAALSDAPINPKFRRLASTPTYYPTATAADGAQPIRLRPGEQRENIDIQLVRTPAYCIDGALQNLGPAQQLRFSVSDLQARIGTSANGGLVGLEPGGETGPGGKFRICDLSPGQYRITGASAKSPRGDDPVLYGEETFTIADRDVHNVVVPVYPGVTVPAQLVWANEQPDQPNSSRVGIGLYPLYSGNFSGNASCGRSSSIPSDLACKNVAIQDYRIHPFLAAPDLYVKDILYGQQSVRYGPWRPGTAAAGSGLKVLVGHDGGTIQVAVRDKDGKPTFDASVIIFPLNVASPAAIQETMVQGETDQNGQYTSDTLAPGRYRVLATLVEIDPTTETIDKIWARRARTTEVDLAPGGRQTIALEPVGLE